jgi:hypothetical protein
MQHVNRIALLDEVKDSNLAASVLETQLMKALVNVRQVPAQRHRKILTRSEQARRIKKVRPDF